MGINFNFLYYPNCVINVSVISTARSCCARGVLEGWRRQILDWNGGWVWFIGPNGTSGECWIGNWG